MVCFICLVYLVYLVCLVYLVSFVDLVGLVYQSLTRISQPWQSVIPNRRGSKSLSFSYSEGNEDRLTKPILDHLGRNVTPPDFRKDRQIAPAKELLKPKYHAYGFRTVDLLKNLPQFFRNPAQIRHEINKLRVR